MAVRTIVGFVADFPTDHSCDGPPGEDLAKFVAQHLARAGFAVNTPSERDGWAWDLYTKEDELEIMTIVGLVDDMETTPPRQWLITNDCNISIFKRLFGGKSLHERRDRLLRKFCETLYHIMSSDQRFSCMVWYDPQTFDKPSDKPGNAP